MRLNKWQQKLDFWCTVPLRPLFSDHSGTGIHFSFRWSQGLDLVLFLIGDKLKSSGSSISLSRNYAEKTPLNLSSSRRNFNMNILLLHVGLHVVHFSLRKCILYWLSNGSLHLNCHKSLSSLESSDGLVDLWVQKKKKLLQARSPLTNSSQVSLQSVKLSVSVPELGGIAILMRPSFCFCWYSD